MSNGILEILGNWASRTELVQAIASRDSGFLLAGERLQKRHGQSYELKLLASDSSAPEKFAIAGRGRISSERLELIRNHQSMVRLIGPVGTFALASEFLVAGSQVAKCGAIALKVETSGLAHTAEQWIGYAENAADPDVMRRAMVVYVGDKGSYASFGMKHFGFRDVEVVGLDDASEAAAILDGFARYLLTEDPRLASGHVFSLGPNEPRFRLKAIKGDDEDPEDPFFNPNGSWRLSPVD